MLFNSIDFAVFLPIVFFLYWFGTKQNITLKNIVILGASYFFYGMWDWRFLFLIFFSSIVDFIIGNLLGKAVEKNRRRLLLAASIGINIGFLMFFKYYNFFVDSFANTFKLFGHDIGNYSLNIVLPVGISFYTFQTLSYSIDIYRKKIEPTKNLISFLAFVSFFPQLVAGPIERAADLLPQFNVQRRFSSSTAIDGLKQMLWGLFKKIVIADNCARVVNEIFANYSDHQGLVLYAGAVLFAFQIYCDFSGYSDIAIGSARLFGINLKQNFAFPYFSRDIAEFWRRWHISLSSWFRDYIYIPLGGSKVKISKTIRNVFIVFLVSGFWHGANWTFILWGLVHAFLFIPLLIANRNRKYISPIQNVKFLPSFSDLLKINFTFFLTTIAWIFFRSDTVQESFEYFYLMFSTFFTKTSVIELMNLVVWDLRIDLVAIIIIFLLIEWKSKNHQHGLQYFLSKNHTLTRWSFYYVLILAMFFYSDDNIEFIYFQF